MLRGCAMKDSEKFDAVAGAPAAGPVRGELLQAIWDHSLDAILLTAPDGRIFAANPAACCLFDRTEKEICQLGRNGLLDLSDPELAAALVERERMGQARRELMFVRADGSRFWGEVTSSVFTDHDGQQRTSMIIRDSTERRRAAELIRDQAVFPMLNPGPVLRVEADGTISMTNPAAVTAGLATGANFQQAFPATSAVALAACIREGTQFVFEAVLGDKIFHFTCVGEPAHQRALLYGADITARQRAEDALRESERQYRDLFEYMFSGFVLMEVLFDANGQPVDHRLLQANAEFDRMTGLKRAEEIGRTGATLGFQWPPEVAQQYYRVALGGAPLQGERFNASLQRYYDRRIFSPRHGQFAMIFSDITARKLAEAALQKSAEKFRTIFKSSPSAIGINRASDGVYLDVNEAFARLVGYTREEIIGHSSVELQLWQSSNRAAVMQEVLAKKRCPAVEIQGRSKNGEVRDLIASIELVELDGEECMVGILTDITERRRAEEALRRSEKKFHAIFDLAPVGISLLDAERRITDLNPALEKITQLSKAELQAGAHQRRQYLRADGSPLPLEEWPSTRAIRDKRSVLNEEIGIVLEDGHAVWTQFSAAPLDLPEASAVVITQDIGARKQAELALKENEQRLRVGLELANIAVFNQDLKLRYTWMYQPQLGYTVQEVLGKTDYDLLPRAAAEQSAAAKREALAKNAVVQRELRVDWKDGPKIYVLMVEPLRNAAGVVTGLTGATLDVTERRRTAAALRESEERLQLVMEATHDGLWDWNLRTGQAYLSPRYYEMTGYAPGEITPDLNFYKRVVHPDDFPRLWQTMDAHLQGQTEQSVCDYRMLRKDGTILWVLGRGRVVERAANGAPLRMAGTITDITARKAAEDALAQSQAAREEERQQLARRVHDELGHSYTDLKLDLSWLDRRLAERKLTRASGARKKIATMIQRVEADLNIARTISTDLRPAVLDTLGLAAALEWAAQQFEQRNRIACKLDLPADMPTLGAGRAAALFRAFQEILTNVSRHAAATIVHVRLTADASAVTLAVNDNGRGITSEQRDDPRALGLLGLRERALEFGGTVEIAGAPGAGTTVCIHLPLEST